MFNIYIIKNIVNETVYIGKTNRSLGERFAEHLYKSTRMEKEHSSKRLYKAMNEIGQDKFYIKLLETCENEVSHLREAHYIKQYPNNYNHKLPLTLSKETLEELIKTKTLREIAKEYGYSDHSSIRYLLQKYEIKVDNKFSKCKELTKELLEEEYVKNGLSQRAIMRKYNLKSKNTVRQRLEKYGIKRPTTSNSVN